MKTFRGNPPPPEPRDDLLYAALRAAMPELPAPDVVSEFTVHGRAGNVLEIDVRTTHVASVDGGSLLMFRDAAWQVTPTGEPWWSA